MGEITVILLLALIFLGPSKLPELATSLGKLIRELRKATSDVKNEINLDESFRKPFEDLRDAVTLHPDELKRRDQLQKDREEAAKRAAEEMAKYWAENPKGEAPPDGLANPVVPGMAIHPPPPVPSKLPEPNGPNETIVQAAPPRGATLDDVPTPPPETTTVKPPGLPPAGTVARAETPASGKHVVPAAVAAPAPAVAPPVSAPPAAAPVAAAPKAGDNGSNTTQILKEEDLIPSSSGGPPPPPHLPGLRPVAPRPSFAPPPPPLFPDKKKP